MGSQVPSLPPLVEGQLRCFLALKVGALHWTISTAPKDIQVAITWWGQKEQPLLLRPSILIDAKSSTSKSSEIDFPIRCGPKQFSAYLKDMSLLQLDVLYGPSLTKFAKVEIKELHNLTASYPITGSYPIICTAAQYRNKSVGRLDVSLVFKSISDVFAASTSTPVHSLASKETRTPITLKEKRKKHKQVKSRKTSKDRKNSPDRILYHATSPISGSDKDISFVVGPGVNLLQEGGKRADLESLPALNDIETKKVPEKDSVKFKISPRSKDPSEGPPKNSTSLTYKDPDCILSSLLSKGQQLRNEMLKSTIQSQQERLNEVCRNEDISSGSLIKELLDDAEVMEDLDVKRCDNQDIEQKAVDLVLGKEDNIKSILTKFEVSDDSEPDYSDDQDPILDSSLLSELFYTTKKPNPDESSILFSDSDEDNNMNSCKKINQNVSKRSVGKNVLKEIKNREVEAPAHHISSSTDISDTSISGDDAVSSSSPVELSNHISIQKLTELARVKSIKLTFKELFVSNMNATVYFIEISFPISIDWMSSNVIHEVVRVVSRNISDTSVNFNRVSVFPAHFNEKMIKFWWRNNIKLTVLAKPTNDSKPIVVGYGSLKLQKVMIDENFSSEYNVSITKNDILDGHGTETDSFGNLKVLMELSGDQKFLSQKLPKISQPKKDGVSKLLSEPNEKNVMKILTPVAVKTKSLTRTYTSPAKISNALEKDLDSTTTSLDNTLLQNVIIIEEGKDIIHDRKSFHNCNLYFICRVFWSKEEFKSKICWDCTNPNFQYQQITAVSMTSDSINKMKNNYMIIEVWHKSTTTQSDKLIGMSKVSLHQFYLSFRDSQIADTLMKSKYPVISCDGWIPVINLLSASEHGSLKVLFALGTHDQIIELLQVRETKSSARTLKNGKLAFSKHNPSHLQSGMFLSQLQSVVHDVEITIQSMHGMLEISQEVWGETDCFVQYQFPTQKKGDIKLCQFQSKPTLCVPSPVFNHTTLHTYTLQPSSPLQKILLHGFNNSPAPSEVVFEMWKRHYYPNIRDQLVATASLAMPKLCALITMHDKSDVSAQAFSLPFITKDSQHSKAATLDVLVKYQNHLKTDANETQKIICLRVSILKLCGLKTCAMKLKKEVPELEQYLGKGLNLFVRFYLSFTEEYANRTTQVVAQSFSPTFNYHAEFALPLFHENSDGKPKACLARLMENGYLICDVLHEYNVEDKDDVCIGRIQIPLYYLLSRNTGIKSWWPLYLPKHYRSSKKKPGQEVGGGINLEVKFVHSSARDLIINNGMGESWTPPQLIRLNDESWLSSGDVLHDSCYLYIHVDRVWLPNCIVKDLLPLAKHRKNIYVYSRYKFYDKSPVCTHSMKLVRFEDGVFECTLAHTKSFKVAPTTSFAWYLREESFEIQFWVSMASESTKRTDVNRTYDKLIGSCFVDWSVFSQSPFQKHSFSGVYNFFKTGCDDICSASARLAFSMNERCRENISPVKYDTSLEYPTDDQSTNDESGLLADISTGKDNPKDKTEMTSQVEDVHQLAIHFHIEEALHLPLYLQGDSYCQPDVYVSYQVDDTCAVTCTNVCRQTTKPKFDFQKVESLNPEVLKGKTLAFKVWRCVKELQVLDRDVLLGMAHVDLEPLFVGMKQITGWYNIQDFNRKIIGQLKVGIIPSVTLSPSRSSKFFKNFQLTAPVNFDMGLFSKYPETEINVENMCRSVLFEQLKRNLNDLSEMTQKIKNRVDPVCPISLSKGLPSYDQKVPDVDSEPQHQTYLRGIANNHLNIRDVTNDQLTNIRKETELKPDHSTTDSSLLSGSVADVNLPPEDKVLEVERSQEHCVLLNDSLQSLQSNQEETCSHIENQSVTESTADELMEHLKLFEMKYKHLKDIAQSDDVDFSRVLPEVGKSVENLESQSTNDSISCRHDDLEIMTIERTEGKPVSVDFAPSKLESENTFLENQASSEKCQYVTQPDDSVLKQLDVSLDDENKDESTCEEDMDDSNSVKVNDDIPTLSDNIPTLESIPVVHKKFQATTLPNFFMRPTEMAESIKALRLAANFRRPPRTFPLETEDKPTPQPSIAPKDNDKALMDRIKAKIPVEPSEMARIASIFSSNLDT